MTVFGILGGGQLGWMLGREAQRLGLQVAILDPDPNCSARRACDHFVQGSWRDAAKARELAGLADVVTVETEHIGREALEAAANNSRLYPAVSVVTTVHDRLVQKEFLAMHHHPQPAFQSVASDADLRQAVATLGTPLILKTRSGGYDGKGQARIRSPSDAAQAWKDIGRTACIAEAFVAFDKEISVVLARSRDGQVACFPVVENVHRAGILHTTSAPASVSPAVAQRAVALATAIAHDLGHVGTMAVEMFLRGEDVLVNEIAPRVHNSGHLTLDACVTSQFEQHVRAVMGMPLGSTALLRPAVMLNLLGDLWANGTPDWNVVHEQNGAHLHLYSKEPRPGRKVGHVTVMGEDASANLATAERLHRALARVA